MPRWAVDEVYPKAFMVLEKKHGLQMDRKTYSNIIYLRVRDML